MIRKGTISIKELAEQLNLSVTTVSRVLNGKARQYRIKEETEKQVKTTAAELNYAPNQFARSLKLAKSETIGVIVPDISNPFFAEIFKNIERELKKHGYAVFVGDSNDNTEEEIKLIHHFVARKVDGLVMAPVGVSSEHLNKIFRSGLPLVLVDRTFKKETLPTVTSDNYQGSYLAATELLKNGHRKIALIQGLKQSQPNTDRINGFIDAMKEWNNPEQNYSIVGNSFTIDNGFEQTHRLLNSKKKPTAIFALSNLIALGVLKGVAHNGLNIPDDISLISFDEQAYSAFLNTPMTTIEQNKEEMGRRAVQMLLAQINGKPLIKPAIQLIETSMHVRASIKKRDV